MNFARFLMPGMLGRRDEVCLSAGDAALSHEAFLSLAAAAQAHVESTVGRGERVGLLGENSPLVLASYVGILAAGRVVVPLNPEWGEATLAEIVRACGIRLVFAEPRAVARHRELAAAPDLHVVDGEAALDGVAPPGSAFAPVADPPEVAVINFTSGTSGRSKGVMVSHGNLIANTESILAYLGLGGDDRVMLTLPIFYCYGASVLHTHLAVGASLRLNNRFMFAEKFLDDLEAHRCTGFSGVPAHFQALVRRSTFLRRELPSLRYVTCAGGQLAPAYVQEIRSARSDLQLFLMYGQTEATARLSYLPLALVDRKPGSIGRGIPGVTLKVVREDGTPVAEGERGEVIARGENVALGYWRDPEATARRFRMGWLHTGDIATVDREGDIYIADRAEDVLKSVGHRVSPMEIEDVIVRMPEVAECAVVATRDPELGECLGAYVVPQPGVTVTADAVIRFCRRRLPTYKVPVRVALIDGLPRSGIGKVLRRRLPPL